MTPIYAPPIELGLSQYAFEDFAIRQVALLLNNPSDVAKYTNRTLVSPAIYALAHRHSPEVSHQSYRNIWDPDVESDGFRGEESLTVYLSAFLTKIFVSRFHAKTFPEWNFRGSGPRGLLAY